MDLRGDEGSEKIKLPIQKKPNLLWLWILLTALISAGAMGAFAYRDQIGDWFKAEEATETAEVIDVPAQTETSKVSTPIPKTSVKIVDEGITWLNPRQKLSDLKLFTAASGINEYTGSNYYKVATTSDGGEIILALAQFEGLGTYYDFHHFLKKDGVYYWLSNNSDKVGGEGGSYQRINSSVNDTLKILSLLPDKTIITGSTVLTQDKTSSKNQLFADSTSAGKKVGETKWGDLFLLENDYVNKEYNNVKSANYYILRNDGMKIIYSLGTSFRLDDGTLNMTWSNKIDQDQKFSQVITSGCGHMGGTFPLIVDTNSLTGKTEVGKSASGSSFYSVRADSSLADLGYNVYNSDNLEGKVTKEEFINSLGVLVWQDDYKNWIIFMNDRFTPAYECGKPVIYLYPEKDTAISIKVGANISKSEPEYQNGWSVLARQDGELLIDDETYLNLFWEGIGYGPYPTVKTGTVVERSKVRETIISQLSYIGLNSREISDFLEFWIPKMPSTKYVRLSWLTTNQMDRLAPLKVNPAPETSIRVFLDFSGLNQKISILPQFLPKYKRSGYTLVEWGGLLIK